jgi:hypothetical protein
VPYKFWLHGMLSGMNLIPKLGVCPCVATETYNCGRLWQVMVARGIVQELQRGAQGHEGARGCPAGGLSRRRRVPCRRQGNGPHVDCSEGRDRVGGRAVLRCLPLACQLHPELLLPRLHPRLQVTRSQIHLFFKVLLLGDCCIYCECILLGELGG